MYKGLYSTDALQLSDTNTSLAINVHKIVVIQFANVVFRIPVVSILS